MHNNRSNKSLLVETRSWPHVTSWHSWVRTTSVTQGPCTQYTHIMNATYPHVCTLTSPQLPLRPPRQWRQLHDRRQSMRHEDDGRSIRRGLARPWSDHPVRGRPGVGDRHRCLRVSSVCREGGGEEVGRGGQGWGSIGGLGRCREVVE